MIRLRLPEVPITAVLSAALIVSFLVPSTGVTAQGPAASDTVSVEPWQANEVLAAKEFVAPPGPIAEAALAPRWLNVSLSEPNVDGSWFLDEVGDGPVGMDTGPLAAKSRSCCR